jgi:hypothetical protein
MSNQARVSSIDALESFRSGMVQYIAKTKAALEEMSAEARRTKDWLDHDRLNHWTTQIRKRTKALEQAQQELYSANLLNPLAANALQKMGVQKAKRALVEAEEKLRIVNHWRKRFEPLANPALRQIEPMFFILGQTLPKGVVSITESIKALQAYAEVSAPPPVIQLPAEPETEGSP